MSKVPKPPRKSVAKKKPAPRKKPQKFGIRTVGSILDELDEMRDRITQRAYEIFDLSGRLEGRELENWLEAEQELTFRPPVELTENSGAFTLEVATPGFAPEDLDVQVTAEDILIKSDRTRPVDAERIHRSELGRGRVFRDIRLPSRIDPEKAEAEYRNGMLRVTAPIVGQTKQRVKVASR